MTIKTPAHTHIPALKKLWQEAFGDSEAFIDGFFATGFALERCRLVEEAGVSAALYWFDGCWQEKKLAYIYAVATAKACRGRGLCRALMEDTHRHLKKLGYQGALLVPAEDSLFIMYKAMGYLSCCPMHSHTLAAAQKAEPLTQLDAAGYARAQKMRLPADGVYLHSPALAYLAAYCRFYQGEDWTAAAYRQEDKVYVQEFLGNTEKLPGLIRALGGKTGVCRLTGAKPYAMYYPLQEDRSVPGYFGLPLD